MRSDYLKAANRRYTANTTNEATLTEQPQLGKIPLRRANPMMAPGLRTDVIILRDLAMLAKNKHYPENKYFAGTLEVINQVDYEGITLVVHILPHAKDHYPLAEELLPNAHPGGTVVVELEIQQALLR